MNELINVLIDITEDGLVINELLALEAKKTNRRYSINYFEVINEYLVLVRQREINRDYNQIRQDLEPLWRDQFIIEMVVTTLEAKLYHEVVFSHDLIYPLCQAMFQLIQKVGLSLHSAILNHQLGGQLALHYNFKVTSKIDEFRYLLTEKAVGDDFFTPTFDPWIILN